MLYKFEVIKGTENVVVEDIKKFFEVDVNIQNKFVEAEIDLPIYKLRVIKSALRVTDGKRSINLFRRDWKKFSVPAGINPSLAYIMCSLSQLEDNHTVYDPFCGAGTIVLTSALMFNIKKGLGSDVSGTAIDYSIANTKEAKVKNVSFFRSNISQVKLSSNTVDRIITNLPFGIREQNHDENKKIYRNFAQVAEKVIKPYGLITVLTTEKNLLEQNFRKWEVINKIDIEQGGLYPSIYILRK